MKKGQRVTAKVKVNGVERIDAGKVISVSRLGRTAWVQFDGRPKALEVYINKLIPAGAR